MALSLHNRVLLVLAVAGLAAAFGLAFLTQAPNRLVTGTGMPLRALMTGPWLALLVPAATLLIGPWLPSQRATHVAVALASSLWLGGLLALAGDHARQADDAAGGIGRIAFGGGFWVLAVLAWLAAADAVQRLNLRTVARTVALAAFLAPVVALAASGGLDALSLGKEYENRSDVFHEALWRHAAIVGATLVPTPAVAKAG